MSTTAKFSVGALAILLAGCAGKESGTMMGHADEAIVVAAENANYKEVIPGVSKAILWGDHDKGPYGAFTKFAPGVKNPLHTHSSDLRLIVVKGAYLYWKDGKETRVSAGSYMFVPGGDKHQSGGDAKEGCIFYETSQGKFDLNIIEGGKK